jgi:murein DD-endopeptidase MepM/ murein hydrolase activator NlpD
VEGLRGLAGGATGVLGPREALADEGGWDLVDDGRRLDYEDYTAYDDALDHAARTWDAMGSVAVEPSGGSGTDVAVGDGDLPAGVSGQANSSGNIVFSSSVFGDPDTTDNARRNIALHEFGHALGFDHEFDGPSVMYNQPVWNGTNNLEELSELDEENYYAKWGEPAEGTPVANEPGGEAGEVIGNPGAVFPLDEEHFDSYTDTWGASRSGGSGVHEGTDLIDGVSDGDPIYSITAGTVVPVSGADGDGWNELGGWTIMVEASESVGPIQAGDMLYYAHMIEPASLQPGDTVEAGDRIGSVGSTGEGPPGTLLQPTESRGHHLHLGWYDPSGARAEMPSGAMNPYPMLEWLKENGGTVTGGSSVAPAPCEEGTGPGVGGTSSLAEPTQLGEADASALLQHPNFSSDATSVTDLRNGEVDGRLIAVLLAIVEEHEIYVSCIRSGHPYGAYLEEIGMPDVPNSHYSGRTADISKIDGMPVAGNGTSEAVLDVGRILAGIPPGDRPDEIIGPVDWSASLGYGRSSGWIEDKGLQEAHYDHLHVGFQQASGTSNTQ